MRYALATDSQHWRARELTKELTTETDDTRARKCESAREREGTGEREKRPVLCERGRGLWPDACEGIGKRELVHEDTKQVVGPA